jgi:hypothetical protein
MLFEEDKLVDQGNKILNKIEISLRELKADYGKALADYEELKRVGGETYDRLEPDYLKLLSKFKKSINASMNLWDQTIANVEKLKAKRRIKAEYFMTGVLWTIGQMQVEGAKKEELIEDAKKLIC